MTLSAVPRYTFLHLSCLQSVSAELQGVASRAKRRFVLTATWRDPKIVGRAGTQCHADDRQPTSSMIVLMKAFRREQRVNKVSLIRRTIMQTQNRRVTPSANLY